MLAAARILLPLALLGATAHAADEPWSAVTQACDEEAERTICALKAGCPNWQWLTRCTVENYYDSTPQLQARLEWCIATIEGNRSRAHTPAMVGDPVADALGCLGVDH